MLPIEFLRRAARARPDAIAVEDGHRSLTFAELVQRADALAAGLQALTGRARPRVAVLSANSIDLFVAIMAIHAGGFWLVPLNPRNAAVEIEAQIATAQPDAIIAEPTLAAGCLTVARVVSTGEPVGGPSMHELIRTHRGGSPRVPAIDLGEPNAIKFTGGSSGRPKGVLQSFRCFNTLVASMIAAFDLRADDKYLVAAPMTHGAGMFMMPVLARGGRCVVLEKAGPDLIVEALAHFGITTTWVPPTLLYMLLAVEGVERRRYALRHLIWGGAPAARERLLEARAAFGPVVEAVYGQTEASTIATALTAAEITADEERLDSVGRATLLTAVDVVDPSGASLPPGELGEVVIRGDLVMNGYLGMPDVTAETLRDGRLHTGDVGTFDAQGYLYLKDRIRDVIISGGFNVYPSDVEAGLARHPAVHESVVFGVPDPKWGERVEAAVQLKPGAAATPDELTAFVRTQVGAVKAPKAVHVLAELPRSPVGKVLRREVKARLVAAPEGE